MQTSKSIQTCSTNDFLELLRKTETSLKPALVRARAQSDVAIFARAVLPHHMRLPFAQFHHALFEWHRRMGEQPLPARNGLRFALAAPRGFAKTTIVSLTLVLHDIAYQRENYILIISATQRQAQQRLRTLRAELTGKTPYNQYFNTKVIKHSAHAIETPTVRIEAYGAGSEMRGVTFGQWRPTKIILDDAESSATASSTRRRQRLYDWFTEVIEHLGHGYTNMLAIGTIIHPAGLLPQLMARPDFESIKCRAIERFAQPTPEWEHWRRLLTNPGIPNRREQAREYYLEHRRSMRAGTKVLWPEHEDYEQLQAQLYLQGRRAFYQEKQNEPLGPEDALFEPAQAWRARRTDAGIEILPPTAAAQPVRVHQPGSLRLFGYHDSALGKSRSQGRGDFAALATVGLAADGTLILLRLWIRRAPPSQQVAMLFELHAAAPFESLAIEGTGFQELLTMPIDEERRRRREAGLRHDLPITVVKPTRRKESRIAALEPLLTSGTLALAEDLPEEFWLELSNFPKTEHDDALDAAAGAVELALNSHGNNSPPAVTVPPRKLSLPF